jgi:phage terminase large subunit-like protein
MAGAPSTTSRRRIEREIDGYARAVVDGTIAAGTYHKLACARHLRDRAHEATADFPYAFDGGEADRLFRFAGQLRHYKGKQFAGRPIDLSDSQRFRLGSVVGWFHVETRLPRFTTAYNELPRKSGKTLEAAIVALYKTFFCGEPGAEGYCIATKRQQAKLVFDAARKLVRSSGLRSRIAVLTHNLHRESVDAKLEPLGADADSTDGLNPSVIVTDEFHAHKTRDLVDVMESATGARLTFLHYIITTAGDDPVSPCGELHAYCCQILDQTLPSDPATESTFAFIAHADPEDDWLDEATWRKANPMYGISVNPFDMEKAALAAKHSPGRAPEFKQKRLNLWVSASAPWLSVDGWRAGQHDDWTPDDLRDETCFVGIDLASKLDLFALVAVFPPTDTRAGWRLLRWVWTPADTLADRAHRDRAPYDRWAEEIGFDGAPVLRTQPGTAITHDVAREVLVALRSRHTIARIGFDPWHAAGLIDALVDEDGFDRDAVVEVPQTYAGMSVGASAYEAAVLGGLVDAGGCPLMTWTHANAVVQRDGKGNIFPIKKKSRGRIDPVMAAVIGVNLALRASIETPAEDPVLVVA